MKTLKQASGSQESMNTTRSAADAKPGADHDDCRCKEVSEMSPRELLRLMMSDLAFWKKGKKEGE